jgi:hypothetical protein
MMEDNAEEWKAIPGWEDYEVSDQGRVRRATPGQGTWPGRVLQQQIMTDGSSMVRIVRCHEKKSFAVHLLLLAAFEGPRPDGYQCHHINGIRTDNRRSNLMYVSSTQHRREFHTLRLLTRNCEICNKEFTPPRNGRGGRRRTCSDICRRELMSLSHRNPSSSGSRYQGTTVPDSVKANARRRLYKPRSRVTDQTLAEMISMRESGATFQKIADEFGFTRRHIARVMKANFAPGGDPSS